MSYIYIYIYIYDSRLRVNLFRQSYAKFTLRVAPFLGHCLPIILC